MSTNVRNTILCRLFDKPAMSSYRARKTGPPPNARFFDTIWGFIGKPFKLENQTLRFKDQAIDVYKC